MRETNEDHVEKDYAQKDYVRWIRQRVGSRKIFLVFGSVVLRDDQGRILLQRRTDFDFWGVPGGALEIGEDIVSCARRELEEETGLAIVPERIVGVYSSPRLRHTYPNGDQVQNVGVLFRARVEGNGQAAETDEAAALAWVAPEALTSYPHTAGWQQFFALAAQHLDDGYFVY